MATVEKNAVGQGSAAEAVPAAAVETEIAFVEDPVTEAVERARSGERAGWTAAHMSAETGDVSLALIARPTVRMGDFHAVPFVAAMGVRDAFAALGAAKSVGIRWPHDLVCAAPGFDEELATVSVKAGAGEGGMFAVVALELRAGAFAALELCAPSADATADICDEGATASAAETAVEAVAGAADGDAPADAGVSPLADPVVVAPQLAAAILARIDTWAAALADNRAVAGPLAPVLGEYFDMVPALGHRAAAVSPNGHPLAIGTFAGVDVWGRATIKTTVDEREFAPEVARIRTL